MTSSLQCLLSSASKEPNHRRTRYKDTLQSPLMRTEADVILAQLQGEGGENRVARRNQRSRKLCTMHEYHTAHWFAVSTLCELAEGDISRGAFPVGLQRLSALTSWLFSCHTPATVTFCSAGFAPVPACPSLGRWGRYGFPLSQFSSSPATKPSPARRSAPSRRHHQACAECP